MWCALCTSGQQKLLFFLLFIRLILLLILSLLLLFHFIHLLFCLYVPHFLLHLLLLILHLSFYFYVPPLTLPLFLIPYQCFLLPFQLWQLHSQCICRWTANQLGTLGHSRTRWLWSFEAPLLPRHRRLSHLLLPRQPKFLCQCGRQMAPRDQPPCSRSP